MKPEQIEYAKKHVIDFIQNYMYSSGRKNVVIGLSGGLDSTLVAWFATQALGKEHVFGLIMPCNSNPQDAIDAWLLEQWLDIDIAKVPLEEKLSTVSRTYVDYFAFGQSYLNPQLFVGNIKARLRMIEQYKAQFADLPYPPSFNTGDALVTCKGRVLMIRRGQFPAQGSLALPGGFLNVNTDASLVDCALRELKEETSIKVPPAVLRGSIKAVRTFDHMHRDPRGRIITTAVHIDVSNEIGYPKVRAEDDAAEAIWIPRHQIRRENCFGDHYDTIDTMIGL